MESHRPHRPSKISIWSPTDLPQTLQSSTTDPTDLQKDYLLSIWSPTDPTDLSKLAYGVPQTSHRPCKVLQQTFKKIIDLLYVVPQTYHRPCKALPQTPQTFKKIIYLVYGVPKTPQTFQNYHMESHRPCKVLP